MNRIRHYDFSETEIRRSIDRSLEKLGIDHADVILLHRPDYLMDPEETAGALDALIAEGKTRHVGVSNFSPSRYRLLASKLKAPIVTNQVEFSPIHLDPISDGTFDTALIEGHVPMIWSPIGGGRLMTGDDPYVVKVREYPAGDRRAERPGRARRGRDRLRRAASGRRHSDHRLGQARAPRGGDQGGQQSARPAGLVRGGDGDQRDARIVKADIG